MSKAWFSAKKQVVGTCLPIHDAFNCFGHLVEAVPDGLGYVMACDHPRLVNGNNLILNDAVSQMLHGRKVASSRPT